MTENNEKNNLRGWKLVNFCEFDKYAIKSYCAIHDVDDSLNLGDITKVDESEINDFDLMTWGFPCTDISIAGDQKGFIDEKGEKTRSGMYYEGIRILRTKKPKLSIIENVKNLTSKKFEKEFQTVLNDLYEAGYNTYWKILNAKDFGVPQNRERVFLVSIRKDIDNGKFTFPDGFPLEIRLKDILEKHVDDKFYMKSDKISSFIGNINNLSLLDTKEVMKIGNVNPSGKGQNGVVIDSIGIARTVTIEKGEGQKVLIRDEPKCIQLAQLYGTEREPNPQAGRVYSSEGLSPTMDTCSGGNRMPKILVNNPCYAVAMRGRYNEDGSTSQNLEVSNREYANAITTVQKDSLVIDSFSIRKLTPKECFRLMDFSDDQFERAQAVNSNTQLYKQAGNSIVVSCLYYIYLELYKAIPEIFENLTVSSFFSGIGAFEAALDRLYEYINSKTENN